MVVGDFSRAAAVNTTARESHAEQGTRSGSEILDARSDLLASKPGGGMEHKLYGRLGAHVETRDGVSGVRFAVWAPNATEVCVLTDGNGWQHGHDWLNSSDSGVWSGFIPGAGPGTTYKYSVRTQSGELLTKADPLAFYCELPPKTASIVHDLNQYQWSDGDWMAQRAQANYLEQPVSIYEVQLASWKRPWGGRRYHTYRELAEQLVSYVSELGYTHIELMPMAEYPFDGSWGYQITGYFAPTSRFGSPDDFRWFVDYCHQHGVGVIIDWVPAHFPTDPHGLARFDGTALYEHEDERKGFHPDWNTYIFNYGRHEVREFLYESGRFWLDRYHVDGLRVDAVASMLYLDYSREEGEWVPNQFGGRENLEAVDFLKDFNTKVHGEFPGVLTIAEESTSWGGVSKPVYDGGLGFSMKWDMGWMHDSLQYIGREPIHRQYHQNELSFRSLYAFSENFVLPLSHDEVVHGKGSLIRRMPGDDWQKFANLRLLFGYQYTMPGKKLLFMGGEFGQFDEWDHEGEIDWSLLGFPFNDGVKKLIGDLNRLYRDYPALHELDSSPEGFSWIEADDSANSIYSFCRYARNGQTIVVALNFTPVVRYEYQIGVPHAGEYVELLNSDSELYEGSNVGNWGTLTADDEPSHGRGHSLKLNLPPLGMVILLHSPPAE